MTYYNEKAILCSKTFAELDMSDYSDSVDCPVDWSKTLIDKLSKNNCGRDVLCREGSLEIARIISDISEGKGKEDDKALLAELLEAIKANANCEMSRTAAERINGLLSGYGEKWSQHIIRKRCPDLVCAALIALHIDPEKCTGCGECKSGCPEDAIAGGPNLIHVIDRASCTKCLKCFNICPEAAVVKTTTGAIIRAPEAPIPVCEAGRSGGESRRRRRRG